MKEKWYVRQKSLEGTAVSGGHCWHFFWAICQKLQLILIFNGAVAIFIIGCTFKSIILCTAHRCSESHLRFYQGDPGVSAEVEQSHQYFKQWGGLARNCYSRIWWCSQTLGQTKREGMTKNDKGTNSSPGFSGDKLLDRPNKFHILICSGSIDLKKYSQSAFDWLPASICNRLFELHRYEPLRATFGTSLCSESFGSVYTMVWKLIEASSSCSLQPPIRVQQCTTYNYDSIYEATFGVKCYLTCLTPVIL